MDEKVAVLLAGMLVVFFLCYVVHSIRGVRETREIEQTKREIAAYVAEGSIAPDDAVKLLHADGKDEAASTIADGVAWGMIKPEKAERLIRTLKSSSGNAVVSVTAGVRDAAGARS